MNKKREILISGKTNKPLIANSLLSFAESILIL